MNLKITRPTISDVATAAQAGKTSVSRYLNGEQHLLSPGLRSRIAQAIKMLKYRPSQVARGLKRGRTRLIGLIIADITNPYSVEILSGIEAACRENGFTPLVCNTHNQLNKEQHYLDLLQSYQVEGIIVNAVGMSDNSLKRLQQFQLPIVLIDRKIADFTCDLVGLNNTHAAAIATEHLIEQGFNALLFLSEPIKRVNTRHERLQSFLTIAGQQPGVIAENDQVSPDNRLLLDNRLKTFQQQYAGKKRAIISANGVLTLHIAQSLRRIGLTWGQDIGLLGFDELPWAELAGVGITTLKQPAHQMGYAALQQVISRIENPVQERYEQIFSGELIIRGSSRYR